MTKFKIGDRVACYGQNEGGNLCVPTMEGDRGTVVGHDPSEFIIVKLDPDYGTESFLFHPKQLRKLKPPQKPLEFRVLGLEDRPDGVWLLVAQGALAHLGMKLREVKQK